MYNDASERGRRWSLLASIKLLIVPALAGQVRRWSEATSFSKQQFLAPKI